MTHRFSAGLGAAESGPGLRGVGLVTVGGTVGTLARYLLEALIGQVGGVALGVLVVNLTGSLALGLITGTSLSHPWGSIIAAGLLGGYTTFSTASLERIQLLMDKRYLAALVNGPGMLIACTLLAIAGIVLTST